MFTLSQAEATVLRRSHPRLFDFSRVQALSVLFETDASFCRSVLAKPLKPAERPLGYAQVAHFPQTTTGLVYSAATVMVAAVHKGEQGWYCLTMPETDDVAIAGGREGDGWPKKYAEHISLERDGSTVTGSVVRRGTEILTLHAELTGPAPATMLSDYGPAATDLDGHPCSKWVSFVFKAPMSVSGKGLEYLPRLVRQVTLLHPRDDVKTGTGKLALHSSPSDPIGEVPVRDVLWCTHGTWDNTMLPGRVVARAWNLPNFATHAIRREDAVAYLLDQHQALIRSRTEQRRLWKAVRRY